MKTKSNIIGALILLSTFMVWLSGVGETVKELSDWHGMTSPAIVGILLSQFGKLFSAALGGMLIDFRSGDKRDRVEDKVSNEKIAELNKKEDQ